MGPLARDVFEFGMADANGSFQLSSSSSSFVGVGGRLHGPSNWLPSPSSPVLINERSYSVIPKSLPQNSGITVSLSFLQQAVRLKRRVENCLALAPVANITSTSTAPSSCRRRELPHLRSGRCATFIPPPCLVLREISMRRGGFRAAPWARRLSSWFSFSNPPSSSWTGNSRE
jgi:hypothetical protein